MNLAALANLICIRCGQVQTKDVTACKTFLTFRHDQLYRSKLWKDSLIEWVYPIDPTAAYLPTSNFMPTKGNVILPAIFEHVIAARTSEHKLDVDRPMLYYRVDSDEFAKTGIPLNYLLLSKAVWEFDTAANPALPYLSFWQSNAADVQTQLTIDVAGTDFVSIMRLSAVPGSFFVQTDRIETLLKVATVGTIDLVAGPPVILVTNNSANNANFTATYQNAAPVAFALVPGSTYALQPAGLTSLSDGVVNFNMPANTQRGGAVSYIGSGPFFIASISQPILTLQPTDTQAPKRQRLRLMDIPGAATTLRILGKRAVPPFAADGDTPGVDGMEAPLMALAYYDMLHRDERGGSKEAADALEEASGLLKQLEAEEVVQAASNTRILPETGLGPDEYYIGPIF